MNEISFTEKKQDRNYILDSDDCDSSCDWSSNNSDNSCDDSDSSYNCDCSYNNFYEGNSLLCVNKENTEDINNCNVINKAIGTVNNFVMMKIRYIDMQDLDNFVMNNVDENLLLLMLLLKYNHLLKSINLLINANIIHCDLKGPNVVFDTKDTKPIIIDYGLSIPIYKKIN